MPEPAMTAPIPKHASGPEGAPDLGSVGLDGVIGTRGLPVVGVDGVASEVGVVVEVVELVLGLGAVVEVGEVTGTVVEGEVVVEVVGERLSVRVISIDTPGASSTCLGAKRSYPGGADCSVIE